MSSIRAHELIKQLKSFDKAEVHTVAKAIVNDRLLDIGTLLIEYIINLQEEKDSIQRDVVMVSEAGLALGEKNVRKSTGVGGRTRSLSPGVQLAMTRCLLEAGALKGSVYGDQLRDSIDISDMDEGWYKRAWQPNGKVYQIKDHPETGDQESDQ